MTTDEIMEEINNYLRTIQAIAGEDVIDDMDAHYTLNRISDATEAIEDLLVDYHKAYTEEQED